MYVCRKMNNSHIKTENKKRKREVTAHTSSHSPMLRATALLGLISGASAGAVELTGSNFDDLVTKSGKNAFVKCARAPPRLRHRSPRTHPTAVRQVPRALVRAL